MILRSMGYRKFKAAILSYEPLSSAVLWVKPPGQSLGLLQVQHSQKWVLEVQFSPKTDKALHVNWDSTETKPKTISTTRNALPGLSSCGISTQLGHQGLINSSSPGPGTLGMGRNVQSGSLLPTLQVRASSATQHHAPVSSSSMSCFLSWAARGREMKINGKEAC